MEGKEDDEGLTLLAVAVRDTDPEISKLLIKYGKYSVRMCPALESAFYFVSNQLALWQCHIVVNSLHGYF